MALITCPKCGKRFSDRAVACPQCGATKEEIDAFLAEQERLRKEREAKAAEEARIQAEKAAQETRIRAEKRKEWWKKHWWKITIVMVVLIIGASTFLMYKEKQEEIQYQKYLTEANELVEKQLFYDAIKVCDSAQVYTKGHSHRQTQLSQFVNAINDSIKCHKMARISPLMEWPYERRVYYIGTINNKYAIHVSLWGNGGRGGDLMGPYLEWIEGAYYYDSNTNGLNDYMTLEQESLIDNHLILVEYNNKRKQTGKFDGIIVGNVYEGNYIRAKDLKKMPFRMEYVTDMNDGTFVEY